MADLTVLDEKLPEVLGLARAAQAATKKVTTLARREFALPIQQRHVDAIRDHSLRRAGAEDPNEPA